MNVDMGLGLERAGMVSIRWQNRITGDCRRTPPLAGELDWVAVVKELDCTDWP
jgi:hypothetical protein